MWISFIHWQSNKQSLWLEPVRKQVIHLSSNAPGMNWPSPWLASAAQWFCCVHQSVHWGPQGTVKALCWYPSDKPIKSALITGPSSSAANALEYCQEDQLLWLRKINAFLSLPEAIIWWQRSSTLSIIFQLMSTVEQILTTTAYTCYSEMGEGRKESLSNSRRLFSGLRDLTSLIPICLIIPIPLPCLCYYTLHVPSLLR